MRLTTINIMHGGGRRLDRLLRYIRRVRADVLVLSEFRRGADGEALRQGLAGLGFAHVLCPDTPARTNTVAIASRMPIAARPVAPPSIDRARIVAGDVAGLLIVGVYFAVDRRKQTLFDYLLGEPFAASARRIMLGDFNTGLHNLDEAGASFHCEAEFSRLTRRGWVDLWRHKNGVDAREFSWLSHRRNGFRIDHAFASPDLASKIEACFYDHKTRRKNKGRYWLSDHSALHVDFALD